MKQAKRKEIVGLGKEVWIQQYVLTGRRHMFPVYPKSLPSLFTFPLIPVMVRLI